MRSREVFEFAFNRAYGERDRSEFGGLLERQSVTSAWKASVPVLFEFAFNHIGVVPAVGCDIGPDFAANSWAIEDALAVGGGVVAPEFVPLPGCRTSRPRRWGSVVRKTSHTLVYIQRLLYSRVCCSVSA